MTQTSADSDLLVVITRPDGLILGSEAVALGLVPELRREFERRRVFRLRHGVYISALLWSALDPDERSVCRISAYALREGEFATTQSGSGGESVSRANIHLLGFEVPELQVRFADALGFIAFVDFFWRSILKAGEFDGRGKYVKDEYLRGPTTAQVVAAEKAREDRVRALGPTSARWDWPIARDLTVFGRFLTRHGIPRAR